MKINTKNTLYVAVFSVASSIVFTAGIMLIQVATQGAIDRNQKLLEQKALLELFKLGDPRAMPAREIARTVETRTRRMDLTDPQTGRTMRVVVAYEGELSRSFVRVRGYAVPIEGMGFWDVIRGYVAVAGDLTRVLGVTFLRQAETPGLGGEIMNPQWRRKWEGLRVSPPAPGGRFVYIGGSAPDSAQDPRQGRFVEAITGATGTSTAVARFVNEDLAAFQRAARAAGLDREAPAAQPGQDAPATQATQPAAVACSTGILPVCTTATQAVDLLPSLTGETPVEHTAGTAVLRAESEGR